MTTQKRSRLRQLFAKTRPAARRRHVLRLEQLEDRLVLSTINWTGQGDGSSWSVGANWEGDLVPGPGDDAQIDTATMPVLLPNSGITVNSLEITGGTLTLPSGKFTTTNGFTVNNGTFNFNGGSVVGAATLSSSTLNDASSGSATIMVTGTSTLSGTLAANQSLVVQADPISDAVLNVASTSQNNGTIELKANGGAPHLDVTGISPFINTGKIRVDPNNGSSPAQIDGPFDNKGLMTMNQATLVVTGSSFTNNIGGIFDASGTLDVSNTAFVNSGTLTDHAGAADSLSIVGIFRQTGAGALSIEIGGTTAGSTFDQVAVSGSASLAGTINVSFINGFQPVVGNAFTVVTFASATGSIATYNGVNQAHANLVLQHKQEAGDIVLTTQAAVSTTVGVASSSSHSTYGVSVTFTATVASALAG